MLKIFIKSKKHRPAQQLVEFALIGSLLVALIIWIIELGYAINIRSSMVDAVKMSVFTAVSAYDVSGTTDEKKVHFTQDITTNLKNYIDTHGLPFSDSITVDLVDIPETHHTSVVVSYQYKPFFTLPYGVEFNGYKFIATQILNSSIFEENKNYSTLTSNQLGSFWKTSSDLDGRRGILKNSDISDILIGDAKKMIAFLVAYNFDGGSLYQPEPSISGDTFARIFNWWGQDLLPPNLFVDITTGNLIVYSPYYSTKAFDTGVPFTWAITALGFTHAVYTEADTVPTISNAKLDLQSKNSALNSNYTWCNQYAAYGYCDDDISSYTIYNQAKSALGLNYTVFTQSDGSYDKVIDQTGSLLYNTTGNTSPKSKIQATAYSFYDSSAHYLLKLFVPNNNFPTPSPIYNFNINLDAPVSKAADIADIIFDNDADGIPNAWDNDSEYLDINVNGIIDGQETALINSKNTEIRNSGVESDFPIVKPVGSMYGCGHYPKEYTGTVQSTPNTDLYGMLPFKADGTLNTKGAHISLPDNGLIGNLFLINYVLDEYDASCTKTGTSSFNALYLKYASSTTYTRIFKKLSTASDKENFIPSALQKSNELLNLHLNDSNKVTKL